MKREKERGYLEVVEFKFEDVAKFFGFPKPSEVAQAEVLVCRNVSIQMAGSWCETNLALLCRLRVDGPDATWTSTRHAEEKGEGTLHNADIPPRRGGILQGLFENELEFGEAHGDDWFLFPSQTVRGNNWWYVSTSGKSEKGRCAYVVQFVG